SPVGWGPAPPLRVRTFPPEPPRPSPQGGGAPLTPPPQPPPRTRLAPGPASTRVMSRTLTPASGRDLGTAQSGAGAASVVVTCASGSGAIARPCGCSTPSLTHPLSAAHPPASTITLSSSPFVQPSTAPALPPLSPASPTT